MAPTVAVLGAGGPTGLECVKRLLAATKDNVCAIVRDPSKYKEILPQDPRLSIKAGDVTDTASLTQAFQGCSAVISAASGRGYWSADPVDHKGVANTASAAKAAGVGQVVLVSSQLVTRQNLFHPVRLILNNIRWGLMDAKLAGEQALRDSGVPYTIVRPGGLGKGPAGGKIVVGQGDDRSASGPMISRADVASVCVAALTSPDAKGVTLEIGGTKDTLDTTAYETQIKSVFNGLKKDTELGKK